MAKGTHQADSALQPFGWQRSQQEKWRRQSVALLLDEEGDEHADVNIDGLVARLDDEEE